VVDVLAEDRLPDGMERQYEPALDAAALCAPCRDRRWQRDDHGWHSEAISLGANNLASDVGRVFSHARGQARRA
jgi:hypothetical protein